eukprot:CCRYP_008297-RA/>CCRYP_008297-RA protein AED:0.37 eAED:0.73 QI:0/0/0/1/1/1/2/0/202
MTFTKCWCYYTMQAEEDPSPVKHSDLMSFVFANRSEENAIYPLIVREIAAAQQMDKMLDKLSLLEAYKPQLVENVQVLCKDGKLVIPQELQQRAVQWYHHYLQHLGTTRLKELFVLRCIGKVCDIPSAPLSKIVINAKSTNDANISTGKDGTEIDFMCVTMIDPATSWFKIVELPVTEFNSVTSTGKKGHKGTNTHNKPKES